MWIYIGFLICINCIIVFVDLENEQSSCYYYQFIINNNHLYLHTFIFQFIKQIKFDTSILFDLHVLNVYNRCCQRAEIISRFISFLLDGFTDLGVYHDEGEF